MRHDHLNPFESKVLTANRRQASGRCGLNIVTVWTLSQCALCIAGRCKSLFNEKSFQWKRFHVARFIGRCRSNGGGEYHDHHEFEMYTVIEMQFVWALQWPGVQSVTVGRSSGQSVETNNFRARTERCVQLSSTGFWSEKFWPNSSQVSRRKHATLHGLLFIVFVCWFPAKQMAALNATTSLRGASEQSRTDWYTAEMFIISATWDRQCAFCSFDPAETGCSLCNKVSKNRVHLCRLFECSLICTGFALAASGNLLAVLFPSGEPRRAALLWAWQSSRGSAIRKDKIDE